MFKDIREVEQFQKNEKRKDIQIKYLVYNYWTTAIFSAIAIIISVVSLCFSLIK